MTFDLDSVFAPHSRSFSMCSSVVSEVSNSSQSINSCGEHGSALGHKNSCNLHAAGVLGGTKALSMSTRLGVGRPAVEKLASPQQAPGRFHEEAWAGLSQKQGPRISQEVEIVPVCAVTVACPSCPDNSPVSPGPGREIRNMLGWSRLEETDRSGVLDAAGDWERKGSYRTAWAVPCDSSCTCSYGYDKAPLSGHILESGVGHC